MPGRAADDEFKGAKPKIAAVGAATVTEEVEVVQKVMVLDITCDTQAAELALVLPDRARVGPRVREHADADRREEPPGHSSRRGATPWAPRRRVTRGRRSRTASRSA